MREALRPLNQSQENSGGESFYAFQCRAFFFLAVDELSEIASRERATDNSNKNYTIWILSVILSNKFRP